MSKSKQQKASAYSAGKYAYKQFLKLLEKWKKKSNEEKLYCTCPFSYKKEFYKSSNRYNKKNGLHSVFHAGWMSQKHKN